MIAFRSNCSIRLGLENELRVLLGVHVFEGSSAHDALFESDLEAQIRMVTDQISIHPLSCSDCRAALIKFNKALSVYQKLDTVPHGNVAWRFGSGNYVPHGKHGDIY